VTSRAAAVLVALIILADAFPAAPVSAAQPLVVVVFGDSIAAGTGLPEAQRSNVWVGRVEQLARGRLRMVNEGAGGRATGALGDFDAMLGRRPRIDILVLALGTNDSADVSGAAPVRAAANLREIVLRARKAYGRELAVLIVAPPNIRKDALLRNREQADQRERTLERMSAEFRELAARLGCEFLSLYGTVPDASLAVDGMHPDLAGNERIARIVLPKLMSIAGARGA